MRFFQWLILAGIALTSQVALSESAKDKKDDVEYHLYWRLGLNTDGSLTGTLPDGQSQGYWNVGPNVPTSRHARMPSYFWLQVVKKLDNGAKAVIKVDNEAAKTPNENNEWANPSPFRIRDLYLELPFDNESSIWAGSRFFEFEDIRLFDYLNHFNMNAHGVGVTLWKNTNIAISFQNEKISSDRLNIKRTDGQEYTSEQKAANQTTATRKNVEVLFRHEMPLATGWALKPMAKFINYGSLPEDTTLTDKESKASLVREKVKGASGYSVGGVLSRWGGGDWGNTHFWVQSSPVDSLGKTSGQNLTYTIGESDNYDFGGFGLLVAAFAQQVDFKEAQKVYKIENRLLVQSDKTTKSVTKASLGVQPVVYLTDRVHAALDLNQTFMSQKTADNDFTSTLVTPILRYSLTKDTVGNPQIYTSVTYGKYDWKAKKGANGKPTDELMTTQSGFEIWF